MCFELVLGNFFYYIIIFSVLVVIMKEILFAQRLADNDQTIRERTLKHLRRFLSVKTMQTPGQSKSKTLLTF